MQMISSSDDDDEDSGRANRSAGSSLTQDKKDTGNVTSTQPSVDGSEVEKMFFRGLNFQLDKVSTFYDKKEAELLTRTASFLSELKAAQAQAHAHAERLNTSTPAAIEDNCLRSLVLN